MQCSTPPPAGCARQRRWAGARVVFALAASVRGQSMRVPATGPGRPFFVGLATRPAVALPGAAAGRVRAFWAQRPDVLDRLDGHRLRRQGAPVVLLVLLILLAGALGAARISLIVRGILALGGVVRHRFVAALRRNILGRLAAVGEHQFGHGVDVGIGDLAAAVERGMGTRGAQHHEVGAHAFDLGGVAQRRDAVVGRVAEADAGQCRAGAGDAPGKFALFGLEAADEAGRVGIEGQPGAHDGLARGGGDGFVQAHEQAEAVQQLRAQLAFFRVHGADQSQSCRVLVRDAVALDAVDAAGADVEQQVDQAVGEQIDFVDVEQTVVGLGKQAGAEAHLAVLQRGFEVERADELFLAGAQRQVDEAAAAVVLRQQLGERACAGGFGRAARTFDQHAADQRVDGGEQQRGAQARLAVQRGERISGHGGGRGGVHRFSRCCSAASRCCSMRSRQSPGSCHRPR